MALQIKILLFYKNWKTPIYDLAVIIFINGFQIIKFFQVIINKESKELEKLDPDIIHMISNFLLKI